MKYMLIIQAGPGVTDATVQGDAGAWMAFDKAVRDSGIHVAGEVLAGLSPGTQVKAGPSGERVVTDGPYTETRELIGGFYVIDVPDLDAALDWAFRSPAPRENGSVVVHPVADFG